MEAKNIASLFLNIGDEIRLTVPDFYYKKEENGQYSVENKNGDDGWFNCPIINGVYKGSGDGVFRITLFSPVKIRLEYHSYIEISLEDIKRIEVSKKSYKRKIDDFVHNKNISRYLCLN